MSRQSIMALPVARPAATCKRRRRALARRPIALQILSQRLTVQIELPRLRGRPSRFPECHGAPITHYQKFYFSHAMLPVGRHLTVGREGAPVRGECALNPSRAHGDESILEWSQIDGLIEAAGVRGVQDILDAFWRSTDDLSANLKVQIAAGEFTEAARTAHAIKGSAANVGAQLLAEAARDIETYIKSERKAGPEAALDRLARIYAETRAALEAHLAAQK